MDNYKYVDEIGVIIPDTNDIKKQVQEEFKVALGQDLNLEDSTPQGRLIEAETIARKKVIDYMALIANMLNLNQSFGIFLDSIAHFFDVSREGATATRVICILTGTPSTTIQKNVQAKDINGNFYYLENDVILDENGEGQGIFVCMIKGAIECPSNSLNTIVTAVVGWTGITNNADGMKGEEGESDVELRKKIYEQQYTGTSSNNSMKSALLKIENVLDCLVLDNETHTAKVIDGITITTPHSIYICVDGGDRIEIAKTIVKNKSCGCAYGADSNNSGTLEEIQIDNTLVKFARPILIPVKIKVILHQGQATEEMAEKIRNAIIYYAQGKVSGVDGLNLNINVSAFEIASAISVQISEVFINQVLIAKVGETFGTQTINISANEKATIDINNIIVE